MEGFKNSRVAIVDGDQTICKSLTEIICRWGLRAESFTRLEAALDNIRGNRRDIILLDICICDMYGLDQILQIGNDLKIIAITGPGDKDSAIRTLKLGVFDFVEEPFRMELLHHSIFRALTVLENERKSKRLVDHLKQSRSELLDQQQRLENLNTQLLETNKALAIFAQNIECEQEEIEKRIALKLRNLIIPMVVRLGSDQALQRFEPQLDMLVRQIEDLTSGFAVDPGVAILLSSAELQVASLIKNGVTTEEIARQLNIAESTVRTHRKNIRKKLKINDARFSLRNFLNHHANYKGLFANNNTGRTR
jgi:FixJ family two-component response regulator